ncbi:hypothetical protein EZV62_010365 [Acer yangbiense]|uniref:Putative GTP diphosphokinase RSH1, chloroplastic n=1 Tax=Acer yangbiense TaxID=1000413 RepID=A0A5C7I2D0_9ROSI|nr:hypothetical protein EZV62_010365 [Acer yangbiense]
MAKDESLFSSLDRTDRTRVKLSNGNMVQAAGRGNVLIHTNSSTKVIHDVLFIPNLYQNLLSVAQLLKRGYSLSFKDDCCVVVDCHDVEVARIKMLAQTFDVFKKFKSMVEMESGWKLKVLRSDNGREYTSNSFNAFCEDMGIKHQLTVPYTPQQNRVLERKIRTVMEMARSLIAEKKLPKSFWAEVVHTSVYILNRLATKAVQADVKRTKLDENAQLGIFIGYAVSSKGYRVYNVQTKKILVSKDVQFDEGAHWNWENKTKEQVADILTKALGYGQFNVLRAKLGVSKKIFKEELQDVKADDLPQMFIAMTEEVRVIIVKLADRLHNMRTLSHMPPHKQTIFVIIIFNITILCSVQHCNGDIAGLCSFGKIVRDVPNQVMLLQSELENLSFMYTNPEDYAKVKRRVTDLYKNHEKEIVEVYLSMLVRSLLTCLRLLNKFLCFSPAVLIKLCSNQNVQLMRLTKLHRFVLLCIIIKPKPCVGVGPLCNPQQICYRVLGLVHGIWTPIPRAMKDYIATPKPNGYQCLHTTVIPLLYESMFQLEVQIRTEEMDLIAERGIAAHYSGRVFVTGLVGHAMPNGRSSRGKTTCLNNANIALMIGWLNAIREWQEEFVGNMTSREFVDTITRDLLGSRVFVFTPRGEIKNLPKGATVIDYAYMIHTEIGNKMVVAKVNGNLVSPTHVLANTKVVEIIIYNALSSKSTFQRHKQWLQHAKTRNARHKIMKFLREQAALSSAEITADKVTNFIADSEEESEVEELSNSSKRSKPLWEKILMNVVESWQASKIDAWHNLKEHSIQWFSVVCIDRKGGSLELLESMLSKELTPELEIALELLAEEEVTESLVEIVNEKGSCNKSFKPEFQRKATVSKQLITIIASMIGEVTTALAAIGVTICSCVVEIDRGRGMVVMLFHVEGNLESLVNACSSVDLILGVLGWFTGCTWPSTVENHQFLEC